MVEDTCSGSAVTRRRARLRKDARAQKTTSALQLLGRLVTSGVDILSPRGTDVGKPPAYSGLSARAHREFFPLPIDNGRSKNLLGTTLPSPGMILLNGLVHASVRALNFMHTGRRLAPISKSPNRAQGSVLDSLTLRCLRLARHLGTGEDKLGYDRTAFSRLVSRGAGGKAVPLQAEKVDSLLKCCEVDPTPFLAPHVRNVLQHPELLFGDSEPDQLATHSTFTAGSKAEYILLVRRQCRSRKVVLGRHRKHSASSFAVAKAETSRQREVWDGGDLSRASLPPPSPPFLSSPSDLSVLECSDDQPLWMSVRDGQSFFD